MPVTPRTARIVWLRGACAGVMLAAFGTALWAQSATTGQIYTCVDAKGRKLTSDRPIVQCLDREQTILNPSGTVKAKLGPVLTAVERSQVEAARRAELKQLAHKEEEKSLNRSLLIRYPNQAAHQRDQDEAVAQLMLVKHAAAARVTVLRAEGAKLDQEMAFYTKDPSKAPPKLLRQVRELTQTLAAQERFLADQDSEIERVNTRFVQERKRLMPLWQAKQVSATPATAR
ncbi:MAG: hypothetical protein AUK51_08595 [Comamonadaceae bacterium CG2_30_59_20]|nr:MAG: hypothetical protein AUK51_08595 [Comamonadaceae bacterium CG2_30_59_20]